MKNEAQGALQTEGPTAGLCVRERRGSTVISVNSAAWAVLTARNKAQVWVSGCKALVTLWVSLHVFHSFTFAGAEHFRVSRVFPINCMLPRIRVLPEPVCSLELWAFPSCMLSGKLCASCGSMLSGAQCSQLRCALPVDVCSSELQAFKIHVLLAELCAHQSCAPQAVGSP